MEAGGAGVNGSADSGAGGPGIQVAIAGPTATTFTGVGAKNPANNQYQYFAGGGGAAGVYGGSAGDGGLGGGGNGRNNDFGQTGESNTGGGGGGSADPDGSSNEVAWSRWFWYCNCKISNWNTHSNRKGNWWCY